MKIDSVEKIQSILKSLGIEAWLLYDFRGMNSVSCNVLGLPANAHQTRRWAYLIPQIGNPKGLSHRIEPHIKEFMLGELLEYSSQDEFINGIKEITNGFSTLAMEYSPQNQLPVVSKVDAGTIEIMRGLGKTVISSGEIISNLAALSQTQIDCAISSGRLCREIMMSAFSFISENLIQQKIITEYDVQQFILNEFKINGMITNHPPIVGVNANAANPHYEPTKERSSEIKKDSLVLIDLWGGLDIEYSVFGDITWVGYTGTPSNEIQSVFNIVRNARNAAYNLVSERITNNNEVTGFEVDKVCRDVIANAGYGEYFTHRTGHSITHELHGAGVNMDSFETNDFRRLNPGISFSIEPGIYLPNKFGVRSELDVVITYSREVVATSEPRQEEIIIIDY